MSSTAAQQISRKRIADFRKTVWEYYEASGRNKLPWRLTHDPYRVLVSEVMLQQTQVSRVIEKYKAFLIRFPNARRLAEAPLSDVLGVWSGLGYNRRAKFLRAAAEVIVRGYGGRVPKAAIVLRTIPGVGPYTASAVRVFAFNEPDALIETNIRAAYINWFFPNIPIILDSEILEYARLAAKGQDPRTWHWALMDYGVHIKKLHKNPARRSAHYAKQSKFEGSLRQVRGAILRVLTECPLTEAAVRRRLKATPLYTKKALEELAKDGLIKKEEGKWRIA